MGTRVLHSVLAISFMLAVACDADSDSEPDATTSTPSPTVTATTASPTPTGSPALSEPTGIREVDAAIAAVLANDGRALSELVLLQETECVSPDEAQALGGPPLCEQGEAPGTVVSVFPTASCEGTFVRDPRPTLDEFVSQAIDLHSVVRAPELPRTASYWPMGQYWVNFTAELAGLPTGIQLVIEDQSIVRAAFACGPSFDGLMEYRGESLPVILGPQD